MPSQKAKSNLQADALPASELRKRRARDWIWESSESDDSNVDHKKARRDEAGDEEHQNGAENLPSTLEEDVRGDERQQEEAVGSVDDIGDRVSMVQRLCTGIDTQLQALNENLSNPESTLIAALSKAAMTAMRHSLEDAPVKRLQQEISQCKQLLVRKQQNFDELHRSSQQEQNEQAVTLQYEQNKVAGLSKQLQDERNKLDKVSASLQTEQTKCAEIQKQLEEEKTKVLEGRNTASSLFHRLRFSREEREKLSKQVLDEKNKLAEVSCSLETERAKVAELSASLQAERVMCTELSDALREEQEKYSDLSRVLAAERRKNDEDVEWHIDTLRNNLSKINFKRSHSKDDSYSKLRVISLIARPLFTSVSTDLLDFFLYYS